MNCIVHLFKQLHTYSHQKCRQRRSVHNGYAWIKKKLSRCTHINTHENLVNTCTSAQLWCKVCGRSGTQVWRVKAQVCVGQTGEVCAILQQDIQSVSVPFTLLTCYSIYRQTHMLVNILGQYEWRKGPRICYGERCSFYIFLHLVSLDVEEFSNGGKCFESVVAPAFHDLFYVLNECQEMIEQNGRSSPRIWLVGIAHR